MCKLIVDKPGLILYSGIHEAKEGGQQPKRNKTIILLICRRGGFPVCWQVGGLAADYFF